MTPEEILQKYTPLVQKSAIKQPAIYYYKPEVIEAMQEYARQERDKALDWAARNVKTRQISSGRKTSLSVDTSSILSGKTSKDLEI